MKRWTKQVVWCLVLLMASSGGIGSNAFGQSGTVVEGGRLKADATWTKVGSPYTVNGYVALGDNVTLTIQEGVEVKFAANAGLTASSGRLIVNGSEEEKVVFRLDSSAGGLNQYNEEIRLGSDSSLKHVDIDHARMGIVLEGSNNTVDKVKVTNSDLYGIHIAGDDNLIKNSTLISNQNGLSVFGKNNLFIGNNITASLESGIIVERNSTEGIYMNNMVAQSGKYGLYSEIPYESIINRFYGNTFLENQSGMLTGTSSIFRENNLLDQLIVVNSTITDMNLSQNYWGTTNSENIFNRIILPNNYYNITIEPFLSESVAPIEEVETAAPILNVIKESDSTVTGKAEPGDRVTVIQKYSYWTSKKEAVADENGVFTVPFMPVPAGEKVEAFATNRYEIKSSIVSAVVQPEYVPPIEEDTEPPGKPMVNEVTDQQTYMNGIAEAEAFIEVKAGHQLIAAGYADENGSFYLTMPKQKAYTELAVTATDKAGNRSVAATVKVKDVTAPFKPQIFPAVTDQTMVVKGTAEEGATVEVRRDGVLIGTGVSNAGSFSISIPLQIEGTQLSMIARDQAGNASEATVLIVLDGTPPALPVVYEVTNFSTSLSGTAEPNARVEVRVNNALTASGAAGKEGKFSIPIAKQSAGTVLVVNAIDAVGNVSVGQTTTVKQGKTGWQFIDGKWYYFDLNTGLKKTGWLWTGNQWYYLDETGIMKTGWLKAAGKWYYLEGSGAMKTGWLFNGGKWYYLEGSGAMKTGWLTLGGKKYYMDASGAMKIGWVELSRKWYYFYKDGSMAYNTRIGGYWLGSDGVWVPKK